MLLIPEYMSFYHARIRRALLLPWLSSCRKRCAQNLSLGLAPVADALVSATRRLLSVALDWCSRRRYALTPSVVASSLRKARFVS